MNIGNLNIKNPIFLAPMAGVTDHPFRMICKNMGAGVVYTEFISANGIIRENVKTLNLMKFTEEERPIGIQIFGESPEIVGKSANIIYNKFRPDLIDINYGCPVPKVTKHGAGSAALKDLCLMDDITSAVIESVPANFPITVKMRAGWDHKSIVSTEAGKRLEKIGIKAITLHPRTTKEQFSGKSNWQLIKELKEELKIPVIGNGDVKSYSDYIQMKKITKCDGVMIGRSALGNPWIFKELNNKYDNKDFTIPTIKEKINICKIHYKLIKNYNNEIKCLNLTKKHFNYYLKGFKEASSWRKLFMKSDNLIQIEDILYKMEKKYYI